MAFKESEGDLSHLRGHVSKDTCDVCNESLVDTSLENHVTKYPPKKKKAEQRNQAVFVSIIETKHESELESKYLLVQRPKGGLLAEMFEFPTLVHSDEGAPAEKPSYSSQKEKSDQFLKEELLLEEILQKQQERVYIGELTHIFSHIKQKLFVEWISVGAESEEVELKADKKFKWVTRKSLEGSAVSRGTVKCIELKEKKLDSCKTNPNKEQKKITSFFKKNK